MKRLLWLMLLAALPAGAATLLSDDFEDGDLVGWSYSSTYVSNVTTQANGGTHSMQNNWPSLGDNYSRISMSFTSSSTTYFRGYWKAGSGFTFNGNDGCPTAVAQKKFIELNKGEYDSRNGIFLQPSNQCGHGGTTARMKWVTTKTTGSDLTVEPWNMFPDNTCTACPTSGSRNTSTNPEVTLTAGQWYCIEIGLTQAGAGTSMGARVQVWVDGVLQIDVANSQTGASSDWLSLDGEHNGGVEQAQTEWWDDILVSTTRVGCNGTPTLPARRIVGVP